MRLALFLGCAALGLAGGFTALAAARADVEALREAQHEARQASARFRALEAQMRQATDRAEQARARSEALAARIGAAESSLTAAERRIVVLERLRAEQESRLAARQQPLVRLTAALQTMARRPAILSLVQPGSVEETVRVRTLLAAALPEIRRRTAALRAEVDRSEALAGRLRGARQALRDGREELRRRRVALARFEATQRARSSRLAGLATAQSDRALALGEEARSLGRLVGSREAAARLSRSLAELPGPLPRPDSGTGAPPPFAYRMPVEGRLLTGVGEISDGGVHSRGLTFAAPPLATVAAPAPGQILYAAPFRSYGQIVIIDHGGGWTTVITDLASRNVAPGQRVDRGTLIGRAGGEDPRVTVELRQDGRPVPFVHRIGG